MLVTFCLLTISYACVSVIIKEVNRRLLHSHLYRETNNDQHRRSSTVNNGLQFAHPLIQPIIAQNLQHAIQRYRRQA